MLIARPRFRLVLLTFVAVLALAGMTSAAASPPPAASGTITVVSATFSPPRTVGTNTVFDILTTEVWTGTFSGTTLVQSTLTIHADGSAEDHGVKTFTGTVNGTSGTVTFSGEAHAGPAGNLAGVDAIIGGSGDLATIHGSLNETGAVPSSEHLHRQDPVRRPLTRPHGRKEAGASRRGCRHRQHLQRDDPVRRPVS
jgi:hypothetical protein